LLLTTGECDGALLLRRQFFVAAALTHTLEVGARFATTVDRGKYKAIAPIVKEREGERVATAHVAERVVAHHGHVPNRVGQIALHTADHLALTREVVTQGFDLLGFARHGLKEGGSIAIGLKQRVVAPKAPEPQMGSHRQDQRQRAQRRSGDGQNVECGGVERHICSGGWREGRDPAERSRSMQPPSLHDVASIDQAAALSTFALILPSELPDKTFVATLVLATRYRKGPVWIGVAAAFFVQCTIAVALGGLLSLLPSRLVAAAAATLFAIGAIVLLRGGLESRRVAEAETAAMLDAESQALDEVAARVGATGEGHTSTVRIVATSFLVLFVAEWGDLSQLLTAGQAARTGAPLSVFIGAWAALLVVSGLAVVAGSWLQQRVPMHRVRFVSAAILAVLTVVAIIEAIRG